MVNGATSGFVHHAISEFVCVECNSRAWAKRNFCAHAVKSARIRGERYTYRWNLSAVSKQDLLRRYLVQVKKSNIEARKFQLDDGDCLASLFSGPGTYTLEFYADPVYSLSSYGDYAGSATRTGGSTTIYFTMT
jgi:hypothetical protein